MSRFQERPLERLARWVYSLLGILLLPFLMAYLLLRSRRQPDYRRHWRERFFGQGPQWPLPEGEAIQVKKYWLHAVSVGETRAAAPLILHWLEQDSSCRIVLTHTTPTGRATGRDLFAPWMGQASARMLQAYLPYDLPWAVTRFLARVRPDLGVLMETELWPNLIAAADQRRLPLALINARLSPRSKRRLATFRLLSLPAIRRLSGIAAQTKEDKAGFDWAVQDKGHPSVVVTGNMKFDVSVPSDQARLGRDWRAQWPHQSIWLAASTRADEESALVNAWKAQRALGRLGQDLLLLVPRHPERFDRVARLLEEASIPFVRRSGGECPSLETQVFLGDSLGEMFAYLAASDLVLIGGSLPVLGGQNPIEACASGRPVFFGPHMFNFHQTARALLAASVGEEITSAGQWFEKGAWLLQQPALYQARAEAARAFALTHQGATAKTGRFLEGLSKHSD